MKSQNHLPDGFGLQACLFNLGAPARVEILAAHGDHLRFELWQIIAQQSFTTGDFDLCAFADEQDTIAQRAICFVPAFFFQM